MLPTEIPKTQSLVHAVHTIHSREFITMDEKASLKNNVFYIKSTTETLMPQTNKHAHILTLRVPLFEYWLFFLFAKVRDIQTIRIRNRQRTKQLCALFLFGEFLADVFAYLHSALQLQ